MSLHKHETIIQIISHIPQTSLHQHGTAQNTADIPQTSLHKHRTTTHITPNIIEASFHKHRTAQITSDIP